MKQRQPEVGENVNRLYYVYGSNVNLWCFRVLLGVGCERFDSLFQTGWKQRQPEVGENNVNLSSIVNLAWNLNVKRQPVVWEGVELVDRQP